MALASYLGPDEIEVFCEQFHTQFNSDRIIPVPIEEIVETKLGLDIVPVAGLRLSHDIDGFLSHDFTQLYIDQDQFVHQVARARFTMAHECGHITMHKEYVAERRLTSTEQWKRIILSDGGRMGFESQANMFANILLMPTVEVTTEVRARKQEMQTNPHWKTGKTLPSNRLLAPYLAKYVARRFDVSEQAAQIRITNLPD